ncbi:YSC84-related protein [Echinimonas agarilytica]|uniref:YSC84-related protein n=1 Tax=Echinimonas agarilytica TaxID=1215918 RepID=A0AA41W4W5_9GAMM|nr:YSC84-related protein [Echinimonas agarilytica]MCM2679024.1 YSC84-related protein [Echinimonas agarilytica]
MRQLLQTFLLGIAVLTYSNACWAESPAEQRQNIKNMSLEVLQDLYKYDSASKANINKAYGYAVFSNVGINLLFLSTANGSGVAHANGSGKDTYMDMFSAGLGLGLGVKDFRGVFVFYTQEAFDNFVQSGWDFSGQADATAKSGKKGDSANTAMNVAPAVDFYQLTENGLALQATLQGTKYYKNDDLN